MVEQGIEELSRLIEYSKAIGLELNVTESFSTRFNLQKLAFFIKLLYNENFDDFGLYRRGPYSANEATLYYKYAKHELTIQRYSVKEEYVEKLKEMYIGKTESVIEGAATALFLIRRGETDWKHIYIKLKEAKPKLSIGELVDSVNLAKMFLLTKERREEILKEAEKESKAWAEASLEDTAENA
ncbi:MAG: hypothetical protein M1348_02175 [Candidatus Parvarchaeota archaeon]|nr:hypothetical protein [Candidatus Parvarchaeota archaeon]